LIGMTTIAVVDGVVTIAIHERSIDSEKPPGFVFAPACSSSGKGQSARLSPLSHGGIDSERGGPRARALWLLVKVHFQTQVSGSPVHARTSSQHGPRHKVGPRNF
jgi:hypothetical protein